LFDVISTAYERTSLIVTANLPFESWIEVLGSSGSPELLDGSTHRCRIIETKGASYRLKTPRPGPTDQAGRRQLSCSIGATTSQPGCGEAPVSQ